MEAATSDHSASDHSASDHSAVDSAVDHEAPAVHHWRASQLRRLGIPGPLAEVYADRIDWHQIARLVQGGCPARLALRVVRLRL